MFVCFMRLMVYRHRSCAIQLFRYLFFFIKGERFASSLRDAFLRNIENVFN